MLNFWAPLAIAFLGIVARNGFSQEVGFIDLTQVKARTEFRRPPASGKDTGRRGGNHQMYQCSDSAKNVSALRANLLSLDRTHYQAGDHLRFEVSVENTGTVPIEVPFSPHLADFQSNDPARKFGYVELQIALWVAEGTTWSTNRGGFVTLYGAADHAGTMVALMPGESVRIVAESKFDSAFDGIQDELIRSYPADRLFARAELYRVQTLLTATQSATVSREICLAHPEGQSASIQLKIPLANYAVPGSVLFH